MKLGRILIFGRKGAFRVRGFPFQRGKTEEGVDITREVGFRLRSNVWF